MREGASQSNKYQVCVLGYLIICVALTLFVQAHNVYPQLLFARLLFSIGGAAASTMVTAILPAVAAPAPEPEVVEPVHSRVAQSLCGNGHVTSPSIASEATITPARFLSGSTKHQGRQRLVEPNADIASSTSRIAGFVGMFTGCGALIALLLFLPLPARLQGAGVGEKAALKYSFYVVALVALILAVWCFFGLRSLRTATEVSHLQSSDHPQARGRSHWLRGIRDMFGNFQTALLIGFSRSEIAIGYLGGFVARASSVGISLFIPLLVNAMFLSSDLCTETLSKGDPTGLPDIKRRCPHAYIVAAELTGVSQMFALVFAPIFGYWSAKVSRQEVPLLLASISGIIGYPLFASQFDPDDSHTAQRVLAFVAVGLIGISQIGAIVCSLSTLSKGILLEAAVTPTPRSESNSQVNESGPTENDSLLPDTRDSSRTVPLSALKGSIAGVYSFYGGAAILILTKVGGLLFDKVSLGAPFYIMAIFNVALMVVCATLGLWRSGVETPAAT